MSEQKLEFSLGQHEYIALCDLLKFVGIVDSGGQAKAIIHDGAVLRNGEVEHRKTAKIRAGEVVSLGDTVIHITSSR